MFSRIVRVFKLDATLFDEVEKDENSFGQALAIVAVVAIVSSLGSVFSAVTSGEPFMRSWLSLFAWAFFGWALWSVVSYYIGTTFFGGRGKLSAMFRLVGFAYAPQVLGIIPCIGGIAGWVWSLLAGFVAVREGLDMDTTKTIITLLLGAGVVIVGYVILGPVLGIGLSLLPF